MTTELHDLLNEDILSLGMRADELRRQTAGARVFYQRVHVLSAGDVQDGLVIPEPASEVRLMAAPASLEDALNLVRAVKEAAGQKSVTAFSLAWLVDRSRSGWGDLQSVLTQLAGAGMRDVAELPADRIDDLAGLVHLARASGLDASRITVADPLGDRKGEILNRIRRCQTDAGAIVRVAPLPRNVPVDKPTTGYDDMRTVALARLTLGEVASKAPIHIEVDWSQYGPKLAQVALTFGADFLDAVPATSDASLGRRRATVEDVERNIRAAGFEPQEYRPTP